MLQILEKTRVGGLELRNSIMRSPTWEGLASDAGEATPALVEAMAELARNRVGLIVASHTMVDAATGRAGPRQLGLHDDALVPAYRRMADAVHAAGGVLAVQLNHAGRLAFVERRIGPSAVPVRILTAAAAAAGSAAELAPCVEATRADIDAFVAAFAGAARRAQAAGADMVMVHAAHGYLVSQFLSPVFNKRTDEYGAASLENRARLLLRIVAAVREAVGPDMPIAVKMNTSDFHPEGLTIAESSRVVVWLAEAGVCLVEASGGNVAAEFSPIRRGKQCTEGYHREGALAWKQALAAAGLSGKTAVALVGGIRDARAANQWVADGVCDLISISRPFIREPDLVLKWERDPSARSTCISCSRCHEDIRADRGFHCPVPRK